MKSYQKISQIYAIVNINNHVQEAFQTSNRHDQKKTNPQQIIINIPNLENKERILKASGKTCLLTYKGKHIRITSVLSAQTLKARKAWSSVIQALRENNCQPRTLGQAKAVHVHQA
jgi:ribosomal protein L35AE/L33A